MPGLDRGGPRDLADDPFERLVHFIRLAESQGLGRQHQAMRAELRASDS